MNADLYDAAILAEAKAAFGAGRLDQADAHVECDNPLCGDRISLDLRFDGESIARVGHVTRGCLLSRAAASLLARHLAERDGAGAADARAAAQAVLEGREPPPEWAELAMFKPVHGVKSRHECVLLPFEALEQALEAREGATGI
jgi:nitrogen fixation protein NifU and related proteins